ncbi:MAG: photosynthetic reaction center subunit H [Leptothrix sp. (in: b-proteobacteria)]
MGTGAITQYVDVAQIVLYLFWAFFAGLIYYLVRENHREGYPMDVEGPRTNPIMGWPVPDPKTYLLHDGSSVNKPDFKPDPAPYAAEPGHRYIGAPLVPVGDPMKASVGPGAYAMRADRPDVDPDGHAKIVPLSTLADFGIAAQDTDPRGLEVIGADGEVGGIVRDLWIDRSEMLIRYLELDTPTATGPRRVLLPMAFCRVGRRGVKVQSIHGHQFANAPGVRLPGYITLLEEEKVVAYYGAGTLYADPERAEPLF